MSRVSDECDASLHPRPDASTSNSCEAFHPESRVEHQSSGAAEWRLRRRRARGADQHHVQAGFVRGRIADGVVHKMTAGAEPKAHLTAIDGNGNRRSRQHRSPCGVLKRPWTGMSEVAGPDL